jgi:hypothetical protein
LIECGSMFSRLRSAQNPSPGLRSEYPPLVASGRCFAACGKEK